MTVSQVRRLLSIVAVRLYEADGRVGDQSDTLRRVRLGHKREWFFGQHPILVGWESSWVLCWVEYDLRIDNFTEDVGSGPSDKTGQGAVENRCSC